LTNYFKVTLAYDGTGFVGWQRQAEGISIQGLLEDALRELDDRHVAVTGAGRTDAGVHALGQVAAFSLERDIDPATLVRALNARLPPAVRALDAREVPASFHPRFGARRKTYRYRIWNHDVLHPFERAFAWHVPGPLDVEAMDAAARRLEGRHDFAAFQAAGSDTRTTERVLFASRVCRGDAHAAAPGRRGALVVYEAVGDGFLRHMVRAVVGTLVEVGRGRRPVEWVAEVLASCDRARAGPTAPALGLVLTAVDYGDALADEP
jgi:tRNA pseudouridine38-40 synthase